VVFCLFLIGKIGLVMWCSTFFLGKFGWVVCRFLDVSVRDCFYEDHSYKFYVGGVFLRSLILFWLLIWFLFWSFL